MSILSSVVQWTETIEELNGITDALRKFLDADGVLETTAAASQLAAELAITTAVTATVRTALSLTRLGLAVSGQIWKWEKLSWAAGAGSGLGAGAIIDFVNEQGLGGKIYDWTHIDPTVNTSTTSAINWVAPRRDPLVLDLDGGGISTSAIDPNAPIYFDQDGDGTLTATGWIAAGEAIVVRDLDGNGLIDSGRELFGDSTVLTRGPNAGQLAANGFEALANLDADANGVSDGKFDANDVAFSSVQLWQDANQDGISQASELHTFAELGIGSSGTVSDAGTARFKKTMHRIIKQRLFQMMPCMKVAATWSGVHHA